MEDLNFSVDSALLTELGEKLVETVHLAVIELVKNAYDADATEVIVRFKLNTGKGPDIFIIDNGVGMTLDNVRDYWMRIATTNKDENDTSEKYGRPRTGSKGIGRFSCRRLGSHLELVTIAHNKSKFEKTKVTFPWTKFKPGLDVTIIKCPVESGTVNETHTGTTLFISESKKDEWSGHGYNKLKRELAVLVGNRGTKRKGFVEDPGFNIKLEGSPSGDEDTIDLRDRLINAGWGTLSGEIDNNHNAVYSLNALGIGEKTITSHVKYPELKGVSFKIGIIVDRRQQLRDPTILSLGTLRDEILPMWGGVQIRFKGFRVYPFGDDDWLEIDHDRGLRRQQPENNQLVSFAEKLKGIDPKRVLLSLVSMRNHVGSVEIDARANGFEMKANREGFLDSSPTSKLKEFVRYGIDWATIYRDYYLRKRAKEDSEVAREYLEDVLQKKIDSTDLIENAVDYIDKEVKNISSILPTSQRIELKKSVAKATDAILKHDKSNKEELRHLRLIASTSSLLLIFSHEVKSLIGSLDSDTVSLANLAKLLDKKNAGVVQIIRENLMETKKRFSDLLKLTSLISTDSRNDKPETLALKERLERAKDVYKLIRDKYDIDIDIDDVPNSIKVKNIMEAELFAIILNILSNSIKSVIAAGTDSRKIKVTAQHVDGQTKIIFLDRGIGLDEGLFDEVFLPFISDPRGKLYRKLNKFLNPEDKYILGTGSGLGLGIVREIIDTKKGSIRFKKPSGGWKTELEIVIP
ncbi:MAG: ATP-binding protein [Bacteroidota bacterium]